MPVLSQHTQDTTYYAPYLTTLTAKSRSQTQRESSPAGIPPQCLSTDTPYELSASKALTRNHPCKGGDKSIQTEVTMRAGHEGPQTLRLCFFMMMMMMMK